MNTVKYWQPDQVEQVREVGRYLQQQRQAQSLSVDAVAEKTRIRSGLIMALESGQVEALPEPVYLRGFAKRYGDFLGLDGGAIADRIPIPGPVRHSSMAKPTPRPTQEGEPWFANPFLQGKVLVVAGTLGLLLGIVYGLRHWPDLKPTQTSTQVSPSPTPSALPTVVPTSTPVPDQMTFELSLTGNSWLDVTVDGQSVLYEMQGSGYRQTWTVKEELVLVAGQSSAVEISINGKARQPFGEGGLKEARFPVAQPGN